VYSFKAQIRVYGMRYFNDEDEYWGGSAEKIIDQGRLTARSIKMFADGKHTRINIFALADETVVNRCPQIWICCSQLVLAS
jgi:hypothetical protein